MYILVNKEDNEILKVSQESIAEIKDEDGNIITNLYTFDGEVLPEVEQKDLYIAKQTYDGKVFGVIYELDRPAVKGDILQCKRILHVSDYKTIKDIEATALGKEALYGDDLYTYKSTVRVKLNELQELLNQ